MQVATFGIEPGQVENRLFRIRLDGLSGLELLFGLFGVVLHGVELAQNHAVLDALGLEAYDLFEFGNGLVEHVAGGRSRRNRVRPSLDWRR